MTDKSKPEPIDPRADARAKQEAADKAVEDAVFKATHDKAGKPIPIGQG